MANSKLLTRGQTAALLGITEADVKQRDGRDLHPERGRDGSWLYEPGEVAAALTGAAGASAAADEGSLTAAAFTLFEKGAPLPQVAIALARPAAVVSSLRRQYDALAGTVSLSRNTCERLVSILGVPVANEAALLERIASLAARARRAAAREPRPEPEREHDDLGEIIDATTGARRAISAEAAGDALAALRAAWQRRAVAQEPSPPPHHQPRAESQPSSSDREAK